MSLNTIYNVVPCFKRQWKTGKGHIYRLSSASLHNNNKKNEKKRKLGKNEEK